MSIWISIQLRDGSDKITVAEVLEDMAKALREVPVGIEQIEVIEETVRSRVIGRIKIARNSTIIRTSGVATILQERLAQQNVEHLSYRRMEAAVSDALAELDFKSQVGDAIEFPVGTFWRKT